MYTHINSLMEPIKHASTLVYAPRVQMVDRFADHILNPNQLRGTLTVERVEGLSDALLCSEITSVDAYLQHGLLTRRNRNLLEFSILTIISRGPACGPNKMACENKQIDWGIAVPLILFCFCSALFSICCDQLAARFSKKIRKAQSKEELHGGSTS